MTLFHIAGQNYNYFDVFNTKTKEYKNGIVIDYIFTYIDF